ncbi:putative fungal-specific transcription factor [Cercophora scortea]|uniref:Fungal-specific transcription factor n=1 Tax=Cercophora scortea TaxID=314031 RepID=A0AAE0M2Z7_9PEZI|nr:putative fungal-specific transcription factor [Cercophora scortea]
MAKESARDDYMVSHTILGIGSRLQHLESLMLNIKDELSESHTDMEHNRSRQEECVPWAQQKIDALVLQGEDKSTGGEHETSLPTSPPFAILDAMIELYFGSLKLNHHFPIWTRNKFIQMATKLRQSSSSERDLASIVCCNNLILMAMSAESLCAHRKDSIQSKETRKTSSIDFDIISGFLANAKRAIKNIDQLVAPRLINLQALLSLSETIFVLAARCAKSVGIHQWHLFEGQLSDDDVKERQELSQFLYILDKAVCWTAGTSPSIPLSDVHFVGTGYPISPGNTANSGHDAARAEMARIEEAIFMETYAIHVRPRNEDQVRAFAASMLSRLQTCLADAGVEPGRILQNECESSAVDLQLLIRSLCVQLLLTWPHKGHPDIIFQRDQELGRMCMKLLLRLWHSEPEGVNHAVFPLFLASLPPLYLHEVLSTIISSHDPNQDMQMLWEFVEMLQTITDSRAEASYSRRLYQLSMIIINLVNAGKRGHKRQRQSPSEGSRNTYMHISELPTPPSNDNNNNNNNNNGFNYMSSEHAGSSSGSVHCQDLPDDLRFDGALFQDSPQDTPAGRRAPSTSGSGSLSPVTSSFTRPAGDVRGSSDDTNSSANGMPHQLWSYTSSPSGHGMDAADFHSLAMDVLSAGESFAVFPAGKAGSR